MKHPCQLIKRCCVSHWVAAKPYLSGVLNWNCDFFCLKLSEDNAVKVTDVGASKEAVDITGTLAGSPAYIAPEVFKSQLYNSKADIYSLGIMLWEIWYGERAFARTESVSLEDFFTMVDNGGRPEHVKGCREPTHAWGNLMKECWRKELKDRPSANECHKRITAELVSLWSI